jgi:hypothetical protein
MPGAQRGATQHCFPIIRVLDIATFHSESACGSREACDSGVGTRTRRGSPEIGKRENFDWRLFFFPSVVRDAHYDQRWDHIDNTV